MRQILFDKFGEYGKGMNNPKPRPLLGSDLLAVGYVYSEILGCEVSYYKDSAPFVNPLNIGVSEIENFRFEGLEENKTWNKIKNQIDYLVKNYGYVETYINLMGIQNIAMDIMGENLMIEYILNPEKVKAFLMEITKCVVAIGKEFTSLSRNVSSGVTSILSKTKPNVYLTSNCTCEMISNQYYEEFLLEFDNILANEFNPFGIHHCGATMEHVAFGYSKVNNLGFVEVGAGSNVGKVRGILPDTFMNLRVSPVLLNKLDFIEIKEHIENLVESSGSDLSLVSVSCVGIDGNTPDEKVINFLKACSLME